MKVFGEAIRAELGLSWHIPEEGEVIDL